MQQDQPIQEEAPAAAPPPKTTGVGMVSGSVPKKGIPKVFFVLLFLVLIGAIGFFVFNRLRPGATTDSTEPAKKVEYVFEEYPDFPGIPIKENTVSFLKLDGKFCLRYKGLIYLPQDTGSLVPRSKPENAEMAAFPWIGLVDAPDGLTINGGPGDEIFSFKASPSNKSFVFIMRWTTDKGEEYHMFRFNSNNVSRLRIFTANDGLFYIPKVNMFSLGGNFLNLSLVRCANCLTEQPETLLYYIPTGEDRNIGKVSYFKWGEDDNVYEYKEHEEGVDPADQILRTNEFFERSIDLLSP